MALFCTILLTMFIAEMGDKTQLLLVAMTSRFKLRDIIIGSAASILVLNGLAVGVGSIISKFVPLYLIKIIAALAFFFFAWSSLSGDDQAEDEGGGKKESKLPILTVFSTFFLAELGDKTQLTANTPSPSGWPALLACSPQTSSGCSSATCSRARLRKASSTA